MTQDPDTFAYNAVVTCRALLATAFLVCGAEVLIGCSSARITTPAGVVAEWKTFEPFRERDTVIEYDPQSNIFKAGINRTDTLTPEKVEAFGRGVGIGLTKGVMPSP